MTDNKFKKNAIRKRMAETGEAYSVAARNLQVNETVTFKSPWQMLNAHLHGGFKSGEVYTIASRPKEGKTTFAKNIIEGFKGNHVIHVNLEDSTINYVNGNTHRTVHATHNVMTLNDIVNITLTQVEFDVLVVDYLKLLEEFHKPDDAAFLMRFFKQLAIDRSIPVILLAQLNRNQHGGVPNLNFMRNGLILEHASDKVMVLSSGIIAPDVTAININIIKNRQGPTANMMLGWDKSSARIYEPMTVDYI